MNSLQYLVNSINTLHPRDGALICMMIGMAWCLACRAQWLVKDIHEGGATASYRVTRWTHMEIMSCWLAFLWLFIYSTAFLFGMRTSPVSYFEFADTLVFFVLVATSLYSAYLKKLDHWCPHLDCPLKGRNRKRNAGHCREDEFVSHCH